MKTRQILGRKVYEKSRPFQYKKKHFVALLRGMNFKQNRISYNENIYIYHIFNFITDKNYFKIGLAFLIKWYLGWKIISKFRYSFLATTEYVQHTYIWFISLKLANGITVAFYFQKENEAIGGTPKRRGHFMNANMNALCKPMYVI